MKNVMRIGAVSILSILLLAPSVGAIYTGEEEAPKEGEFQMTKMLEQGEVIEILDGEVAITETAPEVLTEVLELNEPTKEKLPVGLVIGGLVIIIGLGALLVKRKK